MDSSKIRAIENLNIVTQRVQSVLDAVKTQVTDTKDAFTAALNDPKYTPQQGIADIAALWINGLAIYGAAYGFITPKPTPPGGGGGKK